MNRVYVSGPLHAIENRDEMRRLYEYVAGICERCGFHAYLPHMHTDPERHTDMSSVAVFERDLDALRSADVIVAYIGTPSSGVGAELGLALGYGTRIIAIYRACDRPSRFLLGMLEHSANATTIAFTDEEQCTSLLEEELRRDGPASRDKTTERAE